MSVIEHNQTPLEGRPIIHTGRGPTCQNGAQGQIFFGAPSKQKSYRRILLHKSSIFVDLQLNAHGSPPVGLSQGMGV